MRITLEFLESLLAAGTLCQDGLDYAKRSGHIGLTRSAFIEAVRLDEEAGVAEKSYHQWCIGVFVLSDNVKRRPEFVPTGRFRAVGSAGISVEYDTRESARIALKAAWGAARVSEAAMFDAQARMRIGDTGYSSEHLDIDSDAAPIADYYAAFDSTTGLYEELPSAELAKARARDRRAMRESATSVSFYIEEEIRDESDPEDILVDWRFYEALFTPRP
jgi:hypothetical protein